MNRPNTNQRVRPSFLLALLVCSVAIMALSGWLYWHCHKPAPPAVSAVAQPPAPAPPLTPEELWGIQFSAVRLTMADTALDLRYRVLARDKAVWLTDGKTAAYLLDPASGAKLLLRTPLQAGGFPPTAHRLASGAIYSTLVPNTKGVIKRGSQVAVVVGEARTSNLTVE